MPPKGSKKKGTKKEKVAKSKDDVAEDTPMNVDETQPEASTSSAMDTVSSVAHTVEKAIIDTESAVEHAVENAAHKLAEAGTAAKALVEEVTAPEMMTMEDARGDSGAKAKHIGSAAKEFVEGMAMDGVESSVRSETHVEGSTMKAKGKEIADAAMEFVEEMTMEDMESSSAKEGSQPGESKPKLSLEERRAKMEELRKKMAAGTKANKQALAEDNAKAKLTARELARLERQRKLAETLRLKADAEERGEDVERKKNWEYTIEENDEWEKKLARKRRRADYEFHDDAQASRRKYKKDLDMIKPDLEAYNRQKAIAMGTSSSSSALTSFDSMGGASSSAMVVTEEQRRLASEGLYRDANTLIYGDSKPSEEAIDRVVSKISKDIEKKGKFHRKRANEDEGDITYINEHNRVFNKKIARYYDKYTADIRASFERGTAL